MNPGHRVSYQSENDSPESESLQASAVVFGDVCLRRVTCQGGFSAKNGPARHSLPLRQLSMGPGGRHP